MKLDEYFFREKVTQTAFSKKTNISLKTIWRIMQGEDMKLSIALKIQRATDGKVRCEDLYDIDKEEPVS